MNKHLHASVWLFALMSASTAFAQTPPDAGVIRQEVEKQQPAVTTQKESPSASTSQPSAKVPEGPSVTVKEFRFRGNTLIDNSTLSRVVAPFLGVPVDFAALQQAANLISDAYRERGWIVRTYLPLQEINNGLVTFEIVEAQFGEVKFQGEPPQRASEKRLRSMISAQQDGNVALRAEALDRALLLMNDLPGITASGNLIAGKRENTTDLLLQAKDGDVFHSEATVDNQGSRFTGEVRAIGRVSLNSPMGKGEQYGATVLFSQGTKYAELAATMPVGYEGWRVGAHGSYLKYDLIAAEFSALDADGKSTSFGADLTYPLIRARSKNLNLSFATESAHYDNKSLGFTTTDYKVSSVSSSLNGYRFDNLGGGGVNAVGATLIVGKNDLSGSPNEASDALTTQIDGSFGALRYYASRQQRITSKITGYIGLSGQLANTNLDSSEKFYLGGALGVRAYPTSEGGGDQGQLVNVEGRYRLPLNVLLTGFYDWGHITANHDNDFVGASTINTYNLQGAGIAVGWVSEFGFSVKATVAHRIGTNPRATASGNDQDGSYKANRFWLQMSMVF